MIALVGFMGAGKTTVGRILAAKLGLPFCDTDAVVAARTGMEIRDIFRARGESGFRELEREVAAEVLGRGEGVVALGGGAVGDPAIVTHLHEAEVVYLDVGYDEAMRRVGADKGRPMLADDPRALFDQRTGTYRNLADVTVDANDRDPDEIASELALRFGGRGTNGVDRIRVRLGDRSYDVVVGVGVVARLNEFLPELPNAEKAFVVTHPNLRPYASEMLDQLTTRGLDARVVVVPDGERCKSLDVVTDLYDELAQNQAHRHDLIVTFGGGAVGDCAGYVASTYARGMPLVHVPTTLLAQVDASIGGKTAVNLTAGKNLVGTIYQPSVVVCDVTYLATCPRDELRAGVAEVIKYGFISDPSLLRSLIRDIDALLAADAKVTAAVVARCAAIKAEIVSLDERETGPRAYLNYGHTFAHALEKLHAFAGLRHGEAVAIGMMAAAYLAHELGRIDDGVVDLHREALSAAGLPMTALVELPELEEAWQLDKKYKKGVRFVLLSALGRPEAGVEAPRQALLRTLERLRSEP
ncbi:MAG: 3-dehydroquinate synthase [Actinobacteria bacterium]|nr:3-dehydroquinate synthase [Actinomycetota bacterium]